MKTTWKIIRSETNRMKGHTVNKHENSPETFNEYFLSIAELSRRALKTET
jgi:hypothetical protein